MEIKRDKLGWRIEPSTNGEEKTPNFIIDALQDKYAVSVVTQDSETANRLHLSAPVPSMEIAA